MSDLIGTGKRSYGSTLRTDPSNYTPQPCIHYTIDTDKLKDGEFVTLTEPTIFIPGQEVPEIQLPTENVECILARRERMKEMRAIETKPSKEQLEKDMGTMTLSQLATIYGAKGPSTVSHWIKSYGLQRDNSELMKARNTEITEKLKQLE